MYEKKYYLEMKKKHPKQQPTSGINASSIQQKNVNIIKFAITNSNSPLCNACMCIIINQVK